MTCNRIGIQTRLSKGGFDLPADCAERITEFKFLNTYTGEVCTSDEIVSRVFLAVVHGNIQEAIAWVYDKEGF